MEHQYIAVDIETTGLSPVKDRIIEIGAAKVVDGTVTETFCRLIDPQIELPERIVELTNITDEMVKNQPVMDEVIAEFLDFAGELPLLGHNILFDFSFLKTAAAKQKLSFERKGIDTLMIARMLHKDLESKSLDAMCRHYGIVNEHHHRAYDDAIASMMLYQSLAKQPEVQEQWLKARPLMYRPKKVEPATQRQKNYLLDLLKYHKIEIRQSIDTMTRSEASRMVDRILFEYGRKPE